MENEPGRRCLEMMPGWWAHMRPHAGGCPLEVAQRADDGVPVLLSAGEVVTPAGDPR